ncbi:MAG TPA: patatin-like phospholipase family protein [Baekduia sp.]|nr:patatin-like phospholipase family protein [Baekduia sp.]
MRVLAIDGGGIRGLIPAVVLTELERRTGRPISDLFDLIAGTSTGGILACALARPDASDPARPRFTAQELVALYVEEGPKIFDRSLLKRIRSVDGLVDERYEDDGLRAALDRYLGGAALSDARTDVLVTAYELEQRFAFLFRSSRARTDATYDFAMADVAHATSAAPTYFEPAVVRDRAGSQGYALIDGGVFATNPAMVALAELTQAGLAPEVDLLLSLGTGEHTRPIHVADARGWGRLEWASRIVDVVFDGVAETVDFEASQALGDRYIRLQTPLVEASDDLDDASPENLTALQAAGEALVRERAAELDRVVELLGAPR